MERMKGEMLTTIKEYYKPKAWKVRGRLKRVYVYEFESGTFIKISNPLRQIHV
jgi:hypothetical protein